MRDDPHLTKDIKAGSIMQISPDEDHGTPKQLLVVTKVDSWGVTGYLPGGQSIGRTWNMVEPTGGMIVFDQQGKRVQPEKARRHHE